MQKALVICLLIWSVAGFFMDGEDEINQPLPWLVVLGGGVAGERLQLACELFAKGHGKLGVIFTGDNVETFVPDRSGLLKRCGIPDSLLISWPHTKNTYQEVAAAHRHISLHSSSQVIIVSDALHMPRLRFLRAKFGLQNKLFFKQSHLLWRYDFNYMLSVVKFWFREPIAYLYYRIKYN